LSNAKIFLHALDTVSVAEIEFIDFPDKILIQIQ